MFSEIDWVSLTVALLALWITFADYRRNNYVIVRVIECSCSHPQSIHENREQPFHHFRILVRNHGLPLYGLSAALKFTGENGAGTFTLHLKKAGETNGLRDECARGMIAEFYWKSYQLDDTDLGVLLILKDLAKQHARLCLYSGGYFACDFRVGGVMDRLKALWNRFAFKVNSPLKREVGRDVNGVPIVRHYEVAPRFLNRSWALNNFVEALRRDFAKKANVGGPDSRTG